MSFSKLSHERGEEVIELSKHATKLQNEYYVQLWPLTGDSPYVSVFAFLLSRPRREEPRGCCKQQSAILGCYDWPVGSCQFPLIDRPTLDEKSRGKEEEEEKGGNDINI